MMIKIIRGNERMKILSLSVVVFVRGFEITKQTNTKHGCRLALSLKNAELVVLIVYDNVCSTISHAGSLPELTSREWVGWVRCC